LALAWSTNGRVLASGWSDGEIRELDPRSGTVARQAIVTGGPTINALVQSTTKPQFYALAGDGRIAVLDRDRWKLKPSPFPSSAGGLAAAVVDRDRIVAIGHDGLLRLWDLSTGRRIGGTLHGHQYLGAGIWTHSGDPNHVVTVDVNGRFLRWDVSPDGWKARTCTVAGRNLTHAEWNRYLPGESYRATCPSSTK